MPAIRNALIVGAGISGLTAGIALRRAGINVDIAEIKANVTEQPGVGLSLQGNCIAALGRLSLAAACIRAGMATSYINIRRPDGGLIARQPVLQMGGAAYPGTAGISRRALHQILLSGAQEAGVNLRYGLSFEAAENRPDAVEVVMTDGSTARYDLLLGADGIRSKLRQKLFPEVHPTFCGQVIWRAGVPRPLGCFTTELHFGGPYGVVGLCPISSTDAYLYLLEVAAEPPRQQQSVPGTMLRSKLASYGGPLLDEAMGCLDDAEGVTVRGIEQLLVPESWYRSRMVLIGDAAHANPPVLAQGAAMGIEDAVVLAEELSRGQEGATGLDGSLRRFMQRRLPRARMVVQNSVQLSEWETTHKASPQDVARVMRETQLALSKPL
jgi:2-polyprenyl-6-methoxyphenol hydroxylase-like FAD-dependent oxidoreductase